MRAGAGDRACLEVLGHNSGPRKTGKAWRFGAQRGAACPGVAPGSGLPAVNRVDPERRFSRRTGCTAGSGTRPVDHKVVAPRAIALREKGQWRRRIRSYLM